VTDPCASGAVYPACATAGKSNARRGSFDIVRTRDNLNSNVIGTAANKFGYWFWGYFNPAGHPAY
jgi:hypothetical protein